MTATPASDVIPADLAPPVDLASQQRVAKLVSEFLDARCPTTYTWSYESSRADLRALYEKAKGEQWDGRTYLAWDTPVDPGDETVPDQQIAIYGSRIWQKLAPRDIRELRRHAKSFTFSNFLHGEQGALLATAQIVTTVPLADAKFYAATQVMDEARHVEVYERYLREKIQLTYPINVHLKSLLDQILTDPRWDMKYLGMQILVEGLALAAFKFIHTFSTEPLIKELVHMVMRDEARHVAFGVLSLKEFYTKEINEAERREREEFVIEATVALRDRLRPTPVFERLGWDVKLWTEWSDTTPFMRGFRQMMFSKIVPNLRRLGLLTPRVREAYAKLDLLQFEHHKDSVEEPEVTPPQELVEMLMQFLHGTGPVTETQAVGS
jgi:hypothetical protein